MSNKTLVVAGIIVVVIVAAVAVAMVNTDESKDVTEGVIYDGNGGTTSSGESRISLTSHEVFVNAFIKDGAIFQHWNTEKDDSGETYCAGDYIEYGSGKTVKLYAIWYEGSLLTYTSYSTNFSLLHGTATIGPLTPIEITQGEMTFTVSTDMTGGQFSVDQGKMSVTYTVTNEGKTEKYTTFYIVKGATSSSVELVDGVAVLKVAYDGFNDVTISSMDTYSM